MSRPLSGNNSKIHPISSFTANIDLESSNCVNNEWSLVETRDVVQANVRW